MKKTDINLIPDIINPTPDYYCTWQTQLYATSDGKPKEQRKAICEYSLFKPEKPYGWAYFYEKARRDLFLVMDDSWDVPLDNNEEYYGSLILNAEKFPSFCQNTDNGLKPLSDKVKSLGWKGLGGWVCAQESPLFIGDKTDEEYWIERLKAADEAGFGYWKVDWGKKSRWNDKQAAFEFRKMLTDLGRTHAPKLVIEHAMVKEVVTNGDVFRTYDVPAIMSIPMTIEKLCRYGDAGKGIGQNMGLINCEDEAYIAAAGGFAMGIMRHPFVGDLPNGNADMAFPKIHRNVKTKLYEVLRAARWHRIAPAFSCDDFKVYGVLLSDTWRFEKRSEELEEFWFGQVQVKDFMTDDVLTKQAASIIARNCEFPEIEPDKNGDIPYCVASLNPNGVYSIVTLGRTRDREYFIPRCNVTIETDADVLGAFGEYNALTIKTSRAIGRVLLQDIADENSYDITEQVMIENGNIIIPGDIIHKIGTMAQPDSDTSEPGVAIKLIENR